MVLLDFKAFPALMLLALMLPISALADQPPEALEHVKQAIRLKQFKDAQTQLQQLAAAGNADAQYLLAVFYLNGLNGAPDAAAARPWLEKAAAQGHAGALHSLKTTGQTRSMEVVSVVSDPITRRETLWRAAQSGDVATVQSISDRASINAVDAFGRGALARAAEAGQTDIVKLLLHAGAAPDSRDAFGITPLMLAARAKRASTVEVLLQAGADVSLADHVGNTALMHAAAAGDVVTVDRLLKANSNLKAHNAQGWSALDFAEWAEAADAARLLSANGATSMRHSHTTREAGGEVLRAKSPEKDLYAGWDDIAVAASRNSPVLLEALPKNSGGAISTTPDGAAPVVVAVRSSAPRSLEVLLALSQSARGAPRPEEAESALLLAARAGTVDAAKVLLAHGVSPDSRSGEGEPAIVAAARTNHPEMVRLLISAKANPGLQDRSGKSALILAAQTSNDDMMRALVDAGAPVYLTDKSGRTALWYAARAGYLAGVTLLLQHGAKVDQPDANGVSPLAAACTNGAAAAVVERLLASNARVDAPTTDGDTPLLLASAAGQQVIVDKLLAAHANKDAQNEFGDTALIIASRNGDLATVKRLLVAGASTRLRNRDRATAADIATARAFREVAALLKG